MNYIFLIYILTKKEIILKYKGSVFGIFWSMINPIVLLIVYTFVFSKIFELRLGNNFNIEGGFSFYIFSGLITFYLFSETISGCNSLITNNPNYVKKIAFPLEILPITILLTSLFQFFINFGILFLAFFYLNEMPSVKIFLFPILYIPYIIFIIGVSWFVSAAGVFFRDLSQMINLLITVLMFMTPIFYPLEIIPSQYKFIFNLNPLVLPVEITRFLFDFPNNFNIESYFIYLISSSLFFLLGLAFFLKTKKYFSDVI